MKPVKLAMLALGLGVGLGACMGADAPSAPLASSSASLALAPSNGQHLVLFKGNGVPADLSAQVAALGGRVVYAHARGGFAVLGGLSSAAAAQFAARGDVAQLQADEVFSLDAPVGSVKQGLGDVAPASQDEPAKASRYSWQWNMRAIGANRAWAAGKLGSPTVTVAILDTGLDYDIRDLNGLVDLSRSASFIPEDAATMAEHLPGVTGRHPIQDLNGHGTNVASQVSSKALVFAGVTSRTTLVGVKVLGANGSGSFGSVMAGVFHAADVGADVINMSLGSQFAKAGNGRYVGFINGAFNYARQKGSLVVVSAGNESSDLDHNGNTFKGYCDAPHVVCVSATGPDSPTASLDIPSFYTNFGRSAITVAAPGGNANLDALTGGPSPFVSWVYSLCSRTALDSDADGNIIGPSICTTGLFLTGSIGTSQASPHVSGLAALLLAEGGKGNPSQLKHAIVKSADDLGQRGTDPFYGKGRINVARAFGL